MRNRFETRGDVTAIFVDHRDGTSTEFLIDTADLPLVALHDWYMNGSGYALNNGKPRTGMTRIIMAAPLGMDVDHINHNIRDNRRCNLRLLNRSMNTMNRARRPANVYVNQMGKWFVKFNIGRKPRFFGTFTNEAEAIARAFEVRTRFMAGESVPGESKRGFLSAPPGRSGVRGITWNTKKRRWHIIRRINGKQRVVARFRTLEEAKWFVEREKLEAAA